MDTIPVISSSFTQLEEIKYLINKGLSEEQHLILLSGITETVQYLSVQRHKLIFLNFDDENFDAFDLLEIIISDPWLMQIGIIGISSNIKAANQLDKLRGANILVMLTTNELNAHLPRIMKILRENEQMLIHKDVNTSLMSNISKSVYLNNDPVEAICLANLICNFLYNTNKIDVVKRGYLNVSLYELLMNAIEHGNCGITYEEKTAWLESDNYIGDLIDDKCKYPWISRRKVFFSYEITPVKSSFYIEDEGEGFDWRKQIENNLTGDPLELHGRGIMMATHFTVNMTYNDKGNAVSFTIEHQKEEGNLITEIYENFIKLDSNKNLAELKENNQLFLEKIAEGLYYKIKSDKVKILYTHDKIFRSEISFLMNNLEDNSLDASTNEEVLILNLDDFTSALLKKPSYALYISRLLAKKLVSD
ncbi:MAG: hypothetical protein GXX85_00370 [Ignavibacteria bacterium]|nr:hypothetical protein [Ignavibacteria bacterium]